MNQTYFHQEFANIINNRLNQLNSETDSETDDETDNKLNDMTCERLQEKQLNLFSILNAIQEQIEKRCNTNGGRKCKKTIKTKRNPMRKTRKMKKPSNHSVKVGGKKRVRKMRKTGRRYKALTVAK